MAKSWLYRGQVSHTRLTPRQHHFSYPAFFICFPLQERQALASRLFSLDRFNLFSLHQSDQGDGRDAEAWIRQLLQREGVTQADGAVWLMTLPRMLGFVFNPVSFWLCHDRAGALRAVLCEVKNTFGERHCYLLQPQDGSVIDAHVELRARKVFHVSPFFPVAGEYRFRFLQAPDQRTVAINYLQDERLVLKTALTGQVCAMTDRVLLRLFLSLGWSTLLVVLRIHWQALKLWRRGMPFHRKPQPPAQEISR